MVDHTFPAGTSIILDILPVRDGDCLFVSCPTPSGIWRLLIDTGREETWPVLYDRLSQIPLNENGRRHIDLAIVSHIDVDHIGATRSLFADEALKLDFGDIWFNGRRHLVRGVAEGEALGELLSAHDRPLPWNVAFGGCAVAIPRDRSFFEVPLLTEYPHITLLSPTPERLAQLLPIWDAEIKRLRRSESNSEEEREAADAKFPDLEALASRKFRPDGSPTNGASIAILLEHQGAAVLLAADAFATDLGISISELVQHRGLPHPLCVDVFKLSHHGSRANLKSELLGIVEAKHYVISTDGGHGLPNDEALSRIVLYGGDSPSLWFNYATDRNLRWSDDALQTKHKYETHFPKAAYQWLTIVCKPNASTGTTVE